MMLLLAIWIFKIRNQMFHTLAVYSKACDDFAEPISASLRPGNTVPFEEILQR